MKYLMCAEMHTHLRGSEYETDYMRYAAEDAKAVGVCAIMEMPNPQPWITTPEIVMHRHKAWAKVSDIPHYCHIGITNDAGQVERALDAIQACAVCAFSERQFHLRSDKTFYTNSTGNMGVLDPDYQYRLWQKKAEMGYTGVSMGHFEDETLFGSSGYKFDPKDPVTHSLYQGEDAETAQVERQLANAYTARFRGTFYICHVSSPETVRLVQDFRRQLKRNFNPITQFDIVMEITWHHMFLNFSDYVDHGNEVKMNPPLRSQRHQAELLDMVLRGCFDIIGTDHAPHPLERKLDLVAPASGIPALPFWPRGIQLLRSLGISETLLENMIFRNANRIFDLKLPEKYIEMQDNPDVYFTSKLFEKYGNNPFHRLYTGNL